MQEGVCNMVDSCPHSLYFFRVDVEHLDFDEAANTFRDWHIVPLGRPTISPPQQKLSVIDIPGANGVMDLSNSLTKYPVFNNRQGSMTFAVDYDKTDWLTAYTKILRFLQGVNVRMILEDDVEYFYEGRVFVEDFNSRNDGTWSEITLGYDLQPYKRSIYNSTDEDWYWDPFNFETDVIQASIFSAIQVTAPSSASWENANEFDFTGLIDSMPVIPTITVDTNNNQPMLAQLKNTDLFGDRWVNFSFAERASYKDYNFILCEETPESVVKLRLKNPGVITLDFRSGRL